MKMQLTVLTLLAAAAAGPALTQGSFSGPPKSGWNGGAAKPSAYKTYVPPAAAAPIGSATGRIYEPPKAATPPVFKPYEPYKPKSLFGPDGKPKR